MVDDKDKFFKPEDIDIDSFDKWEKNEAYQRYFKENVPLSITYFCDRKVTDGKHSETDLEFKATCTKDVDCNMEKCGYGKILK